VPTKSHDRMLSRRERTPEKSTQDRKGNGMTRRFIASAMTTLTVLGMTISAHTADTKPDGTSEESKKKPFKATCPVMGNPAIKSSFVKFKGKKVYFCCPGCPAQFVSSDPRMAAKAHFQLLQTGQIRQVACPLTGHDLDPEVSLTIDGQKVQFCCPGCLKKMKKLSEDKRFAAVFGNIDKGFTLQTQCPVCEKPIDPAISLKYKGHPVYFHSKQDRAAFQKNPETYAGKLPQVKQTSDE